MWSRLLPHSTCQVFDEVGFPRGEYCLVNINEDPV